MKTSTLYALMGPRGAGATTMIKMATEMGINYIPVYTTEWLHARSRRGILLKRMEQEEFNQQRFFAQTGWRGFQYGWYKQDILEAMAAYRCNLILINEAVIPTFRNFLRRNLVVVNITADYTTLIERMGADKVPPERIQEELKRSLLSGFRRN